MTYDEPGPKVSLRKFEKSGDGFLVVTRYEGGPAEGLVMTAQEFEERWGLALRQMVERDGSVTIRS